MRALADLRALADIRSGETPIPLKGSGLTQTNFSIANSRRVDDPRRASKLQFRSRLRGQGWRQSRPRSVDPLALFCCPCCLRREDSNPCALAEIYGLCTVLIP